MTAGAGEAFYSFFINSVMKEVTRERAERFNVRSGRIAVFDPANIEGFYDERGNVSRNHIGIEGVYFIVYRDYEGKMLPSDGQYDITREGNEIIVWFTVNESRQSCVAGRAVTDTATLLAGDLESVRQHLRDYSPEIQEFPYPEDAIEYISQMAAEQRQRMEEITRDAFPEDLLEGGETEDHHASGAGSVGFNKIGIEVKNGVYICRYESERVIISLE